MVFGCCSFFCFFGEGFVVSLGYFYVFGFGVFFVSFGFLLVWFYGEVGFGDCFVLFGLRGDFFGVWVVVFLIGLV